MSRLTEQAIHAYRSVADHVEGPATITLDRVALGHLVDEIEESHAEIAALRLTIGDPDPELVGPAASDDDLPQPDPEWIVGIRDEDFELVIPFVVVKSNGGKFDDLSFIRGSETGGIYESLLGMAPTVTVVQRIVHTDIVAQIDLIAMSLGWITTHQVMEETGNIWAQLTFVRNTAPIQVVKASEYEGGAE